MLDVAGKVKWFDTSKGYGFIAADDGKGDVFLHYGDLVEGNPASIMPGQAVRFEVGETPYGRRALRVRFEQRSAACAEPGGIAGPAGRGS